MVSPRDPSIARWAGEEQRRGHDEITISSHAARPEASPQPPKVMSLDVLPNFSRAISVSPGTKVLNLLLVDAD